MLTYETALRRFIFGDGAVFLLVGIAHVCKKTDRMLKVRLESDLSAKILAK